MSSYLITAKMQPGRAPDCFASKPLLSAKLRLEYWP